MSDLELQSLAKKVGAAKCVIFVGCYSANATSNFANVSSAHRVCVASYHCRDKTLRSLKRATSHKHWPVHEADCVVALVAGRGDDASEHVKVGKQIFTTSGRMLDRVVFGMRDDAHGLCDKPSHFVFATDQTAAGPYLWVCWCTDQMMVASARKLLKKCQNAFSTGDVMQKTRTESRKIGKNILRTTIPEFDHPDLMMSILKEQDELKTQLSGIIEEAIVVSMLAHELKEATDELVDHTDTFKCNAKKAEWIQSKKGIILSVVAGGAIAVVVVTLALIIIVVFSRAMKEDESK